MHSTRENLGCAGIVAAIFAHGAASAADPAFSHQTTLVGAVSDLSPADSESFLAGGAAVGDDNGDDWLDTSVTSLGEITPFEIRIQSSIGGEN